MNDVHQEAESKPLLRCERWPAYILLIFAAGFFGAFTFLLRGAVFCNAQTFNFVLCASALGCGDFGEFLYYFIPITAYFLGAFLSESAQGTVQKRLPIRWETLLMLIEMAAVLFLGLLPEQAPHRISQVTINLIASMQYNTFRETRKVSMSTTFCTNHLRQIGINASHALFQRSPEAVRRLSIHCKLLSPIFLNMGVSQTDIDNYLDKLSGYIYAILALIVLAVAVMVAAQFVVKKGRRHLVRWGAGLSLVLVVTILANVICFGPMYNNLAPMFNAAKVSAETAAASKEIISEIGQEGMVLVKNDGLLPLSDTENLNVFGWASIDPIYGGTGSGSSDTSSAIGILQSLEDAGFKRNTSLTEMYREYRPSRGLEGGRSVIASIVHVEWTLPEPPADHYTNDLMSHELLQ